MIYWNDVIERAAWTFVQAFLGAFPIAGIGTDLAAWKAAALSGLAAGIAALISLIKNVAKQRLAVLDDPGARVWENDDPDEFPDH